jgi:hypothetical protein
MRYQGLSLSSRSIFSAIGLKSLLQTKFELRIFPSLQEKAPVLDSVPVSELV